MRAGQVAISKFWLWYWVSLTLLHAPMDCFRTVMFFRGYSQTWVKP